MEMCTNENFSTPGLLQNMGFFLDKMFTVCDASNYFLHSWTPPVKKRETEFSKCFHKRVVVYRNDTAFLNLISRCMNSTSEIFEKQIYCRSKIFISASYSFSAIQVAPVCARNMWLLQYRQLLCVHVTCGFNIYLYIFIYLCVSLLVSLYSVCFSV